MRLPCGSLEEFTHRSWLNELREGDDAIKEKKKKKIIYRSYACLINIFNSFLKRGLFLRVFTFIQLSLRILFNP